LSEGTLEYLWKLTFPASFVLGYAVYIAAMISCAIPPKINPQPRKTLRRPYLVMIALFTSRKNEPIPAIMQVSSKGRPMPAISKKYVL
jgi:hypothetical protein